MGSNNNNTSNENDYDFWADKAEQSDIEYTLQDSQDDNFFNDYENTNEQPAKTLKPRKKTSKKTKKKGGSVFSFLGLGKKTTGKKKSTKKAKTKKPKTKKTKTSKTKKAKSWNFPKLNKKLVIIICSSIVVIALIVCAVLFLPKTTKLNNIFSNSKSHEKIEQTTVTKGNIKRPDVADIAEKNMPSVVSITETTISKNSFFNFFGNGGSNETQGAGSGIILSENDESLFIATNNHVVNGASKIDVTFIDGQNVSATIQANDPDQDLAVITVKKSDIAEETSSKIKVATLGDSNKLRPGDDVIAIGNALGLGQSVTSGYISALNREVTTDNNGTTMCLLQTDAAINPGNSGGALLNSKGEVIGINSAKLSLTEVEGMGYAIPISNVESVLSSLTNSTIYGDDEKGYLGVSCSTFSKADCKNTNCPKPGAYVQDIVPNSSADMAGIKKGDIIIKVDDNEIKSSSKLSVVLSTYKKGSKIKITLLRQEHSEYKEQTLDVDLKGVQETNENSSSNKNSKNDKPNDNKPNDNDSLKDRIYKKIPKTLD